MEYLFSGIRCAERYVFLENPCTLSPLADWHELGDCIAGKHSEKGDFPALLKTKSGCLSSARQFKLGLRLFPEAALFSKCRSQPYSGWTPLRRRKTSPDLRRSGTYYKVVRSCEANMCSSARRSPPGPAADGILILIPREVRDALCFGMPGTPVPELGFFSSQNSAVSPGTVVQ